MMSPGNNLFDTAIQRRQMRHNDTEYSWLEPTQNKPRRSSLFETTQRDDTKGFIAQLKGTTRFQSSSETLPCVTCYCDGKECKCLLNTALPSSTITQHLVNKLSYESNGKKSHQTGAKVHVARLTLGSSSTSFPLHITVDCDYEIVLGIDFFRKMDACLNFKENCLFLGTDKIPFKSAKEILLSNF